MPAMEPVQVIGIPTLHMGPWGTSALCGVTLNEGPLIERGVNMPKGILESLLSGEGTIVPHVQPMYRLIDNRLMAMEYLAWHLDPSGNAQPVGPILQDP